MVKPMASVYFRWSVTLFAVTAASVAWLDKPLARYFHDVWAGTRLFGAFRAVTGLGHAAVYIVIALAVVAIVRAGPRLPRLQPLARRLGPYRRASLCVLGSLALSGLALNILKPILGRARPQALFEGGDSGFSPFAFEFHHLNSFPSGHAQTIWAVFAVLMILYPRWRWWFAGLAVAVSASRVVIVEHYLGDVLAGTWLGIAGAVLACAIAHGRIAGGRRDADRAPAAG